MKTFALLVSVLMILVGGLWTTPVEALPGLACGGTCAGISTGFSLGTKKCADLTAAELAALKQSACAKTSKDDARSTANDSCDDGTGTCLCTGGAFSDPSSTSGDKNGKCEVACAVAYQGSCNVVAIPAPVPMAGILSTLAEGGLVSTCSR